MNCVDLCSVHLVSSPDGHAMFKEVMEKFSNDVEVEEVDFQEESIESAVTDEPMDGW